MVERKIRVGVTHGDINGINYEVMLKAFADSRLTELCTVVVYGSVKAANFYKKETKEAPKELREGRDNRENREREQPAFSFQTVSSAANANPKRINLVQCVDEEIRIEPGRSTTEAGIAAVASMKRAMEEYKAGLLDVIVTLPINKSNVQSPEFSFAGHTEFFTANFLGEESLMFMVSDALRIGMVTNHVPVKDISSSISKEGILKKLSIMNASLVRDFAVTNPKIAVLGLNPHTGDGGLLGTEERDTIIPALEEARSKGLYIFGPYSADGFFATDAYRKFDAVLAMYHDEGMIPFKVLSGGQGVNYTAGLPLVRTSPAHGVAYDIAGEDKADPQSFLNAIYTAIDIYRNRAVYDLASRNPLPSYSKEGWGKDQSATELEGMEG